MSTVLIYPPQAIFLAADPIWVWNNSTPFSLKGLALSELNSSNIITFECHCQSFDDGGDWTALNLCTESTQSKWLIWNSPPVFFWLLAVCCVLGDASRELFTLLLLCLGAEVCLWLRSQEAINWFLIANWIDKEGATKSCSWERDGLAKCTAKRVESYVQ